MWWFNENRHVLPIKRIKKNKLENYINSIIVEKSEEYFSRALEIAQETIGGNVLT